MHAGDSGQLENFDLADPALFADDRYLDVLARLRSEDPVHFHAEADGPGFWVVTGHADVAHVYANDELFSSRLGMRLGTHPDAVKAVADSMLIVTDSPKHVRVRRLVGSAFTPPVMRALENSVKGVVHELMNDVLDTPSCDFVSAFARPLPTHVICSFMGLPRADWDLIGQLTTDGIDSDNEEVRREANSELFLYFSEIIEERRDSPGTDLISMMIRAASDAPDADRSPFSDVDLIVNLAGILIGANETTRYAVAGGLVALAEHPQQWLKLQSEPDLVAPAVDEILRWVSPAVHAMRTVTAETTLHGRRLAPGDRVTVWTAAANRDPDVFPNPDEFDLARMPNRHMSFGYGRHVCVGARLARMEISAFLEELRTRAGSIHLAESVEWSPSNFTRGPLRVVARLRPAASPMCPLNSRQNEEGRYAHQ